MNKAELIENIAKASDCSKASAGRALDAVLRGITSALKRGESVEIAGFGAFRVDKRRSRTGRNPRTGAVIKINAAKVVRFKAGKGLRDIVDGRIYY